MSWNFSTEVVPAFSAVRIQIGPPPNFLAAAWPCLVASMSSDGYYLSIDELLLICQVVRQNVCIFEHVYGNLTLKGSVSGHEGPMCCVSLNCASGRSTRGHFQRLVSRDIVAQMREKLQSKRGDEQHGKREPWREKMPLRTA